MAIYTGTNGADTYAGTAGDDTISGGNGDDMLSGGGGNDIINGDNGNDTLSGEAGNDTLAGGLGNDSLTGGAGNDNLTGGNGDDVFSYTFQVTSGGSTFTGWLADQGLSLDGATQSFFSTHYEAWLDYLVTQFGIGSDTNQDGVIQVDLQQNAEDGSPVIEGVSAEDLAALFGDRTQLDVITGNTSQTRFYSDSFSMGSTVTSADGMDVIWDFMVHGADKLHFNGIANAAEFAQYFTVDASSSTLGTSANDTVITLNSDPSWSLTLVDFTGLNPATQIDYSV